MIESNRTLGFFYPTETTPPRAEIPPIPEVEDLVGGYEGREAIAAGEVFDPSSENIQSRTSTLTLKDGLKVAMLPKKSRGNSIVISFTLPFGTEDSLWHQAHSAQLASQMLMRGTVNRSRQEIQDELNRLKSGINIGGTNRALFGSVSTDRENLAATLRVLRDVLREPAFDLKEFELIVKERLANIEASKSDPEYLAYEASQRYLVQMVDEGHPFYFYTADEDVKHFKSATVEDARAFWERFHGSSHGSLAVIGDFDSSEIQQLLSDVFDGWVSEMENEHIPYQYVRQDPVYIDIEDS